MSIQREAAKITRIIGYHAIVAASIAYFAPVATASWIGLNLLGANAWIGSLGYSVFATSVLRYMSQAMALEFALPFVTSTLDRFLENRHKNIQHTVTAIVNLGIWYRLGFIDGMYNYIDRDWASVPGSFIAGRLRLHPKFNATLPTIAAAAGGLGDVIPVAGGIEEIPDSDDEIIEAELPTRISRRR